MPLWAPGLVEKCLSLQKKAADAENKDWELEYLKGKVKSMETSFSAVLNVAFPAGDETWFDGYRRGFLDAQNDLVAEGAATLLEPEEDQETKVKTKERGGDSESEEIEVEESPGYASTAVPGDDSDVESGCWILSWQSVLLPLTCHCPGMMVLVWFVRKVLRIEN